MSYESRVLRRRLGLLLASSGLVALRGFAASELPALPEQGTHPSTSGEVFLFPPAPLIAMADPAINAMDGPSDSTAPAAAAAPITPSQNVTINLINRLVQRGALTKEDASDLIKMAEADAAIARAQVQTQAQTAAAAAVAAAAAQDLPESEDSVHVTYIPESVKAQMRDEIKHDVMSQARKENWAAPRMLPSWLTGIRFVSDVRVRYEGDYFPTGNDNTGAFPNFNAINTGAPFDIAGVVFSPQLNVDQDRQRFRIRARFGAEFDLGEGFTTGIRIATGENNSPVSENQSLGIANQGQGGNFSKYAIWLDRGFLKYQVGGRPEKDFSVAVGRFDNPFFATSMIWANDLGFDGVVAQGRYRVLKGFTPFFTVGGFPVFNTDFNFSSNRPSKFKSDDKWLYAGQLGVDWKFHKDFNLKVGAAYYHFDNVEGKLSDPFTPLNAQDAGNTDNTRPAFAQKGNTYTPLRNIVPNVSNNFGTINQFQYFGLATGFRELALTGKLDFNHYEPFQISLSGEYVKNLEFDQNSIEAKAVNNRGPNLPMGLPGRFAGGDTAWLIDLKVGSPALEKRWDWNVNLGYRHVESDAVIDGFCDSDFGGGGTNLEGYTLGGSLALSARTWLSLRWMSANEIAGPTFKNDVLQIDLNGKF